MSSEHFGALHRAEGEATGEAGTSEARTDEVEESGFGVISLSTKVLSSFHFFVSDEKYFWVSENLLFLEFQHGQSRENCSEKQQPANDCLG